MNKRLMTILLSAFVVAAICSFLVYRAVGSRVQAAHGPATTRIVAAANDIKIGTVLTSAMLTTIDIAGGVPKGALLKPEAAIGRGVVSNLYQGEAIVDDRLAPLGSGEAWPPPSKTACAPAPSRWTMWSASPASSPPGSGSTC